MILPPDSHILATLSVDKGKCDYLGCIFGTLRGRLGSQMVELGCQETNWVGGKDKEVLGGL